MAKRGTLSRKLVHALGIVQLPVQELADQLKEELGGNPMFETERDAEADAHLNLTEESLVADSLPRLPPEDDTDTTSLHLDEDQYETLTFVDPEIEKLFDLEARPVDPVPEPVADSFDPTLLPDLIVTEEEAYLTCEVNIDPLPPSRLNSRYVELLADPTTPDETTHYLNEQLRRGKWLFLCVEQRNHLLKQVGDLLIEEMPTYLTGATAHLLPLPIHKVAKALKVKEETVISVIANKSVNCPAGTLSLAKLFTHAYVEADLPPTIVLIRELIDAENPVKPLSDAQISAALAARGIRCARRTVAKYRYQQGIPSTRVRRQR